MILCLQFFSARWVNTTKASELTRPSIELSAREWMCLDESVHQRTAVIAEGKSFDYECSRMIENEMSRVTEASVG